MQTNVNTDKKEETPSSSSFSTVLLSERIRNIFRRDEITNEFNPKLLFVNQCIFASSIAGFFIGGRIGARVGGVEHIETTKLSVYKSVTHAHREYQAKAFVGFVRNGCKYGWRAGMFSGIYSLLMVLISEANNTEYEGVNYLAAGGTTGVIYKSLSGFRSMIAGGIIGTILCIPVAAFVSVTQITAPADKKKELAFLSLASQVRVENNNLTEDEARTDNLKVTEDIIKNLESSLVVDTENASDMASIESVQSNESSES